MKTLCIFTIVLNAFAFKMHIEACIKHPFSPLTADAMNDGGNSCKQNPPHDKKKTDEQTKQISLKET